MTQLTELHTASGIVTDSGEHGYNSRSVLSNSNAGAEPTAVYSESDLIPEPQMG